MYHLVPFMCFPALMLKKRIMVSMFWLNMFPPHDGVSDTLSPCALMMGFDLDYSKHYCLQFGSYMQTHKELDNLMQSQTTCAIALCPTGNWCQGGYYFMSLTNTSCWLICSCWTELPIPQDVIDCVNTLGCWSQAHQDLTFAWWDGSPIIDLDSTDDDPFNLDYAPSDSDSTDDPDDDLCFMSNSDLTAAGVEEMNNDNDDNASNNNDNNNANDPNAQLMMGEPNNADIEHVNPEEQEIQEQH